MPVNKCSYIILITTALQLFFFLSSNSVEYVAINIAANVKYLICKIVEKTFCL